MLHAPLIAINVLLLPEAAAMHEARALNARLRESSPDSFALDASHMPHVSLLHLVVRRRDVEPLAAALRSSLMPRALREIELRIKGFSFGPWSGGAMLSLEVASSQALSALQAAVLQAASPFDQSASGPMSAAMFDTSGTSLQDSTVSAATLDYVRTFSMHRTGSNFWPHITLGLTTEETARGITAGPIPTGNFKADSLAIFQLGNNGAARREIARILS